MSVPGVGDSANFDSNSIGNALIDQTVTITTLTISGSTAVINTQSYDITVSSSFSQGSGSVLLGTSVFTTEGNLTITTNTFDASNATLIFSATTAGQQADLKHQAIGTIISSNTSFISL